MKPSFTLPPPAFAPHPWSGFVHILCDHCGKEITTCLREPADHFICRACGHRISLSRPTRAFTSCECGFRGRYLTNMDATMMDIPCICGMPNPVSYDPNKDRYTPIRERIPRSKPRKKASRK